MQAGAADLRVPPDTVEEGITPLTGCALIQVTDRIGRVQAGAIPACRQVAPLVFRTAEPAGLDEAEALHPTRVCGGAGAVVSDHLIQLDCHFGRLRLCSSPAQDRHHQTALAARIGGVLGKHIEYHTCAVDLKIWAFGQSVYIRELLGARARERYLWEEEFDDGPFQYGVNGGQG